MAHWTLEGKKAVVTGGTKGIGLAIAQEFLDMGADVLVVARSTKAIEHRLRGSSRLFRLDGDVVDAAFRRHVLDKVNENWGKLDILVNNVGTNIRKKFADYTEEEYRQIFETNIFSAIDLTQRAFHLLKQSGNASVINIAAVAGSMDVQSGPPYGMTKASLIQMTRH